MAEFTDSVIINRSPDEVFAFLCDLENAPNWMDSITKVVKLTNGPVRVGTKWDETRKIKDKEHTATIEVVKYSGPENGSLPYTYAAASSALGVKVTYTYTVAPVGDAVPAAEPGSGFHTENSAHKTRVDLLGEVIATKFLAKPMVPIFLKEVQKADGDHLQILKSAMEGE